MTPRTGDNLLDRRLSLQKVDVENSVDKIKMQGTPKWQMSLNKPILQSRKEQMHGVEQPDFPSMHENEEDIPSVEDIKSKPSNEPLQMSTATLFNERNLINNSTFNFGKNANSPRAKGHNVSQYTQQSQLSPAESLHGMRRRVTRDEGALEGMDKSFVSSHRSPRKESTQNALFESSHVKSSTLQESSKLAPPFASLPLTSPTFKQLSEIFAFMDRSDFEETVQMQQPHTVEVNMADRSHMPALDSASQV